MRCYNRRVMEDLTGVLAIVFIFGGPVLLALTIGGFVVLNNRFKQSERDRARETFERVMRDKLDVIKTAIAMGMASDELQTLDQRLERLIGANQMQTLLHPSKPSAPAVTSEMMDADLVSEVEAQRQKKREGGGG